MGVRRRRIALRLVTALVVIFGQGAVSLGAAPSGPLEGAAFAASADSLAHESSDEPLVMIEVDAADFANEASELPEGLVAALERDVGVTGAEWLAQSEAANLGADVVAELRSAINVVDARMEGVDLIVTVENAEDARLVESVGGIAEFGLASARGIEEIPGLEPATDLRGGIPYIFPTGSGNARCSVGLVGVDTRTDQIQAMSAGHCLGTAGSLRQAATINMPTVSGGTVSSPFTSIGNAALHVSGAFANPGFTDPTYYDLGITPVTGAGWEPKSEIVTWGGTNSGAPLSSAPLVVRDAGPALVGATVCKSGATTGWSCGPITDVDEILPVGGSTCPGTAPNYCVGGIVADICVRGGDSGGPATVGTRAVGITSASTVSSGLCSLGGIGVFGTLYSPNEAYEQVDKVWPHWEPLIGVATPSVLVNDRVFSGNLEHATPRHRVYVEFSTGEKFSTDVAEDGTWSIDASATNPVIKTYSVWAGWGAGSQSNAVAGSLPGFPPMSQPLNLSVTENSLAALTISWSPPESDGGSALTDYVIQYKRSTTSTWTTAADGVNTSTSFTLVGPSAGVTYNFRVQAKNVFGSGPYSSAVTATTPKATPTAPQGLSVPVNDGAQLRLSWSAPASAGAGPVTDYVIQFKRSTTSTWSTVSDGVNTLTSYTFVRPSAGVTFDFRVRAVNAFGAGSYSSVVRVTTPKATPSAPLSLAAPVNDGARLTLTWAPPSRVGAGPIRDYVIQFKRSTSTKWSTVSDGMNTLTSYTFVRPSAGVTFDFRVRAVNAFGAGSYSSVVRVTTPKATPSAPLSLAAPVNDGARLTLTWAPPSRVGAGPVRDYVIQFKRSTSSTWSTVSDGVSSLTTFTFNRPSAGVTFDFRVRAVNAYGAGSYSSVLRVTVPRS